MFFIIYKELKYRQILIKYNVYLKKSYFTCENINKSYFTVENIKKSYFTGENIEKCTSHVKIYLLCILQVKF